MNDAKVAVVTGAMGGLGEAVCRRLSISGYGVVAVYSPRNDNHGLWLEEQAREGFTFSTVMIDVADHVSCRSAVAEILREHGRIDVLVNNASIRRDAPLQAMTPENWRVVMRTGLDSLYNMTRPVLPDMLERCAGRIVNVSCVNAQRGAFGQTNHAAAKAAVHGFTKALALEVASKGITVNTVSPGYLRTGRSRSGGIRAEIMERDILPSIPVGRLGEPAEVAALVAYLASEEAAFVTGANICINGGQHMA